MRLVAHLAHRYSHDETDLDDLIQEGNLGLITAVRRFDPSRGVKLSTYASFWIRAYQLRWLIKNARLVRIGRTAAERKIFFNARGVRARPEAAGVKAGTGAVAHGLRVGQKELDETLRRLDAREVELADHLSDATEPPDELAARREAFAQVASEAQRFGTRLGARDRELFESRWLVEDPPTLEEIGRRFGVSRECARQLEERVLARFRDFSPQLAEAA
jgi:RNA polymerase sigma-32 factor